MEINYINEFKKKILNLLYIIDIRCVKFIVYFLGEVVCCILFFLIIKIMLWGFICLNKFVFLWRMFDVVWFFILDFLLKYFMSCFEVKIFKVLNIYIINKDC